ncbi:acyltransferase [Methyloversatilis sp. XJ19-49]|uniref:acyltransferase family protein n=1 Tax=Methyloversatilis sp. XJ19-49 TaxID=2963429 RepID=UPI00211B948A|nr:acyltransferase [Methyloversatilis sp. XJ19-49]MCQ9377368.1 acyltransferase [Methyloversatilis sp. XJ19-49]
MTAAAAPRGGFLQPIHQFRAIAIVLIVGAHVLPVVEWKSHLAERLVAGFTNESSTFFMFISGFLFQHLSQRFEYRRYLWTKFLNVILPYLLLSLPAIAMFVFVTQRSGLWPGFYDMPKWQQIAMFVLTGKHLAPMWFIPLMALFYLVAPLLVWADRHARSLYWLILPLLVFSALSGRGGQYGPISMFVYFLPVYLFGMVCARYRERVLDLTERALLPLSACALVLYALFVAEVPLGFTIQTVLKPVMIPLILWALFRWGGRFGTKLDYLAEISFGIFFVHAYFIAAARLVLAGKSDTPGTVISHEVLLQGDLFMFVVAMFVVILGSMAFIRLAQHLFGRHSRMLVGA